LADANCLAGWQSAPFVRTEPVSRLLLVGCLAVLGCQGSIELPANPRTPGKIDPTPVVPVDLVAKACEQRALPTQPLRRLSAQQYHHTLGELFGPALAPALVTGSMFPATVITRGFTNDADANTVNTNQSNAIEDNAEKIAATILASPDSFLRALLPCTLGTPITDAQIDGCVDAFITRFGTAAYRRPITAAEAAIARGVYDAVRSSQSATSSWVSVVQFFVQSPALLYRVERGAGPSAASPQLIKLTDFEMASRLSYLFLNSAPDAALTAAATAGELSTPAEVTAQARRLMTSPRFLEVLAAFHRDWLHLYEAAAGKDTVLFPGYTPAVAASLQREPEELLRYVLEQGDGSLKTLLGSPSLPVNPTLAAFYGLTPGAGSAWTPMAIPNRKGLFTRASVMAALAKPNQTSPIHRGNFFRNSVLCEHELVLPANVDTSTPLKDASMALTARERLAPLTTRSDCAGCHRQINPIGLALENFDAAGQFRTTENGATIDASGSIDLGSGPKAYAGPDPLIDLLAASEKVQGCYSLHWFRAALGRFEVAEDKCSVATLEDLVLKSKGDLRELMVSLTVTDAFLFRRPVEQQ
jgi:hypothetical protein